MRDKEWCCPGFGVFIICMFGKGVAFWELDYTEHRNTRVVFPLCIVIHLEAILVLDM